MRDDKDLLSYIVEFILKLEEHKRYGLPSPGQIFNTMQRFIVRCLISDVVPTHPLVYYLRREDFWPPNYPDERLEKLEELFPMGVLVKHTIFCFEYIKRQFEENQKQ